MCSGYPVQGADHIVLCAGHNLQGAVMYPALDIVHSLCWFVPTQGCMYLALDIVGLCPRRVVCRVHSAGTRLYPALDIEPTQGQSCVLCAGYTLQGTLHWTLCPRRQGKSCAGYNLQGTRLYPALDTVPTQLGSELTPAKETGSGRE